MRLIRIGGLCSQTRIIDIPLNGTNSLAIGGKIRSLFMLIKRKGTGVTKIAAALLSALLSASAQNLPVEIQAASTRPIAESEITARIRDLGGGYDKHMAAMKWLKSVGKPAIPLLLEGINANDDVASSSCYVLGAVGAKDPRVMDAFISALKNSSSRSVKREVIGTLQSWGPDAAPARFELARLVKEGTRGERGGAIETLGAIGKPSLPLLGELMLHDSHSVRFLCLWAYRKIGPAAFESLRPFLDHENWEIRHDALYSIGWCRPSGGDPDLPRKLAADPDLMVRLDAIRLLGATHLIDLLREDPHPYAKYYVARTKEGQRRMQSSPHAFYIPPPPLSATEIERRRKADAQIEELAHGASRHLIKELDTARGTRQLILVEWIGLMGTHAGEAAEKLAQFPTEENSEIAERIQESLRQIKEAKVAAQKIDAAKGPLSR